MCTKYVHYACAPSIKTCAPCTDLHTSWWTLWAPGMPPSHQKYRQPAPSLVGLFLPGAPANQVQSAITELICSTSMHCNGAKNIACLPTHGEPNKSPDLRVGTITPDLMPILIDALNRSLCDKPSGWSRSLKKKVFYQMVLKVLKRSWTYHKLYTNLINPKLRVF